MLRSQLRFDPGDLQSEDESEEVIDSEEGKENGNNTEIEEIPAEEDVDKMDVDHETRSKRKAVENEPPSDPKYSSVLAKYKALAASISLSVDIAPPIPLPRVEPEEDQQGNKEEAIQGDIAHPIPQPKAVKKQKVDGKHIPDWIAEPKFIDPSLEASFESLGVDSKFLKNLKEFKTAFAVQAAVIPVLVARKQSLYMPDRRPDILVNAATGSGKTLAYAIPIVQQISTIYKASKVSALVLLPTTPLVRQVREVFDLVIKGTGVSVLALHGGRNFVQESDILNNRCPHIIITTPGRLVDHLTRGSPDLVRELDYFVIDEADRLLNQSFQGWAEKVLSSLEPKKKEKPNPFDSIYHRFCQKLIFSATLTRDPGHLAQLKIFDARIFIVGNVNLHDNGGQSAAYVVPPTLKEYVVETMSPEDKPLSLIQFLINKDLKSGILIFANSNESAARLTKLVRLINEKTIKRPYTIELCSGQIDRPKRAKIFSQFSKGLVDVLVCTDIMARGIDAENISDVINYDLPLSPRDYVHRVGRTARAGKTGSAWTFITTKGESEWFKKLASDISRGNNEIETVEITESAIDEGLRSGYQPALDELKQTVLSARH